MMFSNSEVFNIVLAEDSLSDASLVKISVEEVSLKCQLLHFEDGESCIEQLIRLNAPVHLFILDIKLPKITGIEILEWIKTQPDYKHIPVVVMSTTDNPKEIQRCFDEGAEQFITKPFEVSDYIDAVKKVILQNADMEIAA